MKFDSRYTYTFSEYARLIEKHRSYVTHLADSGKVKTIIINGGRLAYDENISRFNKPGSGQSELSEDG